MNEPVLYFAFNRQWVMTSIRDALVITTLVVFIAGCRLHFIGCWPGVPGPLCGVGAKLAI